MVIIFIVIIIIVINTCITNIPELNEKLHMNKRIKRRGKKKTVVDHESNILPFKIVLHMTGRKKSRLKRK